MRGLTTRLYDQTLLTCHNQSLSNYNFSFSTLLFDNPPPSPRTPLNDYLELMRTPLKTQP